MAAKGKKKVKKDSWIKKHLGGGLSNTVVPVGKTTETALGQTRDIIYDLSGGLFYDAYGRPLKQQSKKEIEKLQKVGKIKIQYINKKSRKQLDLLQQKNKLKTENLEKKYAIKEERLENKRLAGKTGFFSQHFPVGKTTQERKEQGKRIANIEETGGKGIHYKSYGTFDAFIGRKMMKGGTEGKLKAFATYAEVKGEIDRIKKLPADQMPLEQRKREIKKLEDGWAAQQKHGLAKKRLFGAGHKLKLETYAAEGRKKWIGRAAGVSAYGGRNLERTFKGLGHLGEALSTGASKSIGPIQIFQMAWARMSATMKFLVMFVIFAAVLFIPWGIFYYTGWAIAAAFMFLISLIYWLMISILNGVAYVMVTIVNGIVTVIMRIVIMLVESILGFLVRAGTKIVPSVTWAANFEGNPWTSPLFIDDTTGKFAESVPNSYWYEGHLLLHGVLIEYGEIATIPSLMVAEAPVWQSWMNTTVLVKFVELLGLNTIAESFKKYTAEGTANAFRSFIEFAPPYLVVLVALLPAIAIAVGIYWWYKRNKYMIEAGQNA